MKYSSHVILISAQAVPNLTPLLDDLIKPKQVIMLVSADMQQRADWLEAVIKTKGIKTQRWAIKNAWDIEHIRDQVLDLLSNHHHDSIALNATGGTKPMSIAAYEVFRDLGKPIFYVHPEHDRLIWMYPANQPAHELADRIKLPEFLQAYGATVIRQGGKLGVPADYRQLTEDIIQRVSEYAKPLGTLNYYAAQAENTLAAKIDDNTLNNEALHDLISVFERLHLLKLEGNKLIFADEPSRFYVNGGWLEQHVYGVCLNLKKSHGIQDIGRSIEVERSHRSPSIKNEMDVAFLKDNRLYVIECKTHADKQQAESKSTHALYKLDSLKDLLGGLQARAMLVSFSRPSVYDQQRAGDLGIAICAQQDLIQLPEKLATWIA